MAATITLNHWYYDVENNFRGAAKVIDIEKDTATLVDLQGHTFCHPCTLLQEKTPQDVKNIRVVKAQESLTYAKRDLAAYTKQITAYREQIKTYTQQIKQFKNDIPCKQFDQELAFIKKHKQVTEAWLDQHGVFYLITKPLTYMHWNKGKGELMGRYALRISFHDHDISPIMENLDFMAGEYHHRYVSSGNCFNDSSTIVHTLLDNREPYRLADFLITFLQEALGTSERCSEYVWKSYKKKRITTPLWLEKEAA